ncbi:Cof-type HAD-IIB family hydrolase [Anaerosporobacter faecicola]|uniref:Cof-type HAD-IIB family hydrolase n=1 Tax=Anaerosporobacter faecicola TaxID=2718714 RepID=UPI00143952AD|nr:Cof-type HAD-IIB family hydrolase [Anaerosporobacter faecicola]
MNRHILFFDIDGTILSEVTHVISADTKAAIEAARKNGHLAFINTGRTLEELDDRILSLDFDGLVCGCGTYILHEKEVLLNQKLTKEVMDSVLSDLKKCNLEACLEGVNKVYFDKDSTNDTICSLRASMKARNFQLGTFDDSDIDFTKFTIWVQDTSDYSSFYESQKKNFTFIDRGNSFFEIVPHGYSKATGIQFLLDHFNLSIDDAYAFGDSTNDLSMLTYVPHSIAMGNSDPSLFPLVSFVTKDVDDNGISYALKHFNLI